MSNSHRIVSVIVALLVAPCLPVAVHADEFVEPSAVPAAVKSAAVAALPGFVVERAELERGSSGVVYELVGMAGGQRYEIELTKDGRVLGIEPENDVPVALDDLPAPVREAALAAIPGLELREAERVRVGSADAYEIEGTAHGRAFEIVLSPDGEVLAKHDESGGESRDDNSSDDSDDDSSDDDA